MESQLVTAIEEAVEVIFTRDSNLILPMKVAHFLYSEICISKRALDEMVTLQSPLDEKKTSLLTSLCTKISSDFKKFKKVAAVLSKFKKTKDLSEKMINIYAQLFPDDDVLIPDYEIAIADLRSHEDHASHILRCHHGTLSQSLHCPAIVAQLLYLEISEIRENILKSIVQSISEDMATFLLLKVVRDAVHTNYHNLKLFACVLLKFSSNVQCAKDILNDCAKVFCDDFIPHFGIEEGTLLTNESTVHMINSSIREEGGAQTAFDIVFNKIREAIISNPPPIDELERFLENSYNYLYPQIVDSNSINEILTVVRDHCSVIDISCLEGIVKRFNIKNAESHIQKYKDAIQLFCQNTKVSLCLDKTFKVTRTLCLLQCETVVFVLDWDPTNWTLQDIQNIVIKSVEENMQICVITKDQYISVTCSFPLSLTTSLIAKAHETLELVKMRGLIQLKIGFCTIYDKSKRDKEIGAIAEKNKELRSRLEILQTICKKKTMEIASIIRKNKETKEIKEEASQEQSTPSFFEITDQNKQPIQLCSVEETQIEKEQVIIQKMKPLMCGCGFEFLPFDKTQEIIEANLEKNYKSCIIRFDDPSTLPIHDLTKHCKWRNLCLNQHQFCNVCIIHRDDISAKVALCQQSIEMMECHISCPDKETDEATVYETMKAIKDDLTKGKRKFDIYFYCERKECSKEEKHLMHPHSSGDYFICERNKSRICPVTPSIRLWATNNTHKITLPSPSHSTSQDPKPVGCWQLLKLIILGLGVILASLSLYLLLAVEENNFRQLLLIITLGCALTLIALFFWYFIHVFGENSRSHYLEKYLSVIVWFTFEVTVTAPIFWCIIHTFGDNSWWNPFIIGQVILLLLAIDRQIPNNDENKNIKEVIKSFSVGLSLSLIYFLGWKSN